MGSFSLSLLLLLGTLPRSVLAVTEQKLRQNTRVHKKRGIRILTEVKDYNSTKLGDCFLHNIETGEEFSLRQPQAQTFDFVENQQLSVRCDVEGTLPDHLDFIYGNSIVDMEMHTERSAPFFMRGEQPDGAINAVPYLGDSCGPKQFMLIGLGYNDLFLFQETIFFTLRCPVKPECIVPACGWTEVWDGTSCVDNKQYFMEGQQSAFFCPPGSYSIYGRFTGTMADCECCAWNKSKDVCNNLCLD